MHRGQDMGNNNYINDINKRLSPFLTLHRRRRHHEGWKADTYPSNITMGGAEERRRGTESRLKLWKWN